LEAGTTKTESLKPFYYVPEQKRTGSNIKTENTMSSSGFVIVTILSKMYI
jgi:hypothetical protein